MAKAPAHASVLAEPSPPPLTHTLKGCKHRKLLPCLAIQHWQQSWLRNTTRLGPAAHKAQETV